ncbi:helix-turn-helix domain-containing protein [Neolewinella antarctica]|uniref:DNA-binding XRE family transcriptional regulator n=1 Tax=Neolewinella antarctica TaxID=442734 RepID=A0ABX0XGR0_9BACT|nr:helix-turn-helix transcriptional regulator [Neolewinella antarctica]NJC28523.1 DNA-binding XRE family transcriptional regulator [Neolewinella antarctica]
MGKGEPGRIEGTLGIAQKKRMTMISKVLKINSVDGMRIHCTFSTGEYRVVDLYKFAEKYGFQEDPNLLRLLGSQKLNVKVENGTLTFPDLIKEIEFKSGKKLRVEFDLDPIMLYDSSEEDKKLSNLFQIGSQLKKARKQAGLTQNELATRVGTSKSYISRIENNRTDIALKTLRRIVEVGLEKRLLIAD